MKTIAPNRRNLQGRLTHSPARRRPSRPRGKATDFANLSVKCILVPVDFSECSRKALLYADRFARRLGGILTVLNVVEPYIPVPEATMVDVGMIERNLRRAAENLLAELQTGPETLRPFRALIRSGNPAIEVVKAAKSLGADLIIISTHGRTGVGRWLLGSTAEKVVRHASCPVLVVPGREGERSSTTAPSRRDTTKSLKSKERPYGNGKT